MTTILRTVTINGTEVVGYAYAPPATSAQGRALLNMERDFRRRAGGYLVGDHWFHSDLESKVEQIGLLLLGANLPPIDWKTMTGHKVPLTPALAQQIFMAAVSKTVALFDAAEAKAAQLTDTNAATFDYFGGWPVCYWEAGSAPTE